MRQGKKIPSRGVMNAGTMKYARSSAARRETATLGAPHFPAASFMRTCARVRGYLRSAAVADAAYRFDTARAVRECVSRAHIRTRAREYNVNARVSGAETTVEIARSGLRCGERIRRRLDERNRPFNCELSYAMKRKKRKKGERQRWRNERRSEKEKEGGILPL